ncbi:MAG: response regulator [Chloroflexi bacterium]|nr:response regulator [Chloroflexota bacterium]
MKKILVVDDDSDYQMVCETILKAAGYQVTQALNGRAAIEALRQDKPDLILLDVMMSTVLEGIEVSKQIKSKPQLKDVPVVMVSSITTSEYASSFPDDERIPIDAWLSKPIQPDVLLKTVRRFVGQAEEVAPNGR